MERLLRYSLEHERVIRLMLLTLRILFTKESTQGIQEEPKCL